MGAQDVSPPNFPSSERCATKPFIHSAVFLPDLIFAAESALNVQNQNQKPDVGGTSRR
jgi:hypothetical protein